MLVIAGAILAANPKVQEKLNDTALSFIVEKAKEFGGDAVKKLLPGQNGDIEKAVQTAWLEAAKELLDEVEKQGHTTAKTGQLQEVYIAFREYGRDVLKPESPDFPINLRYGLVLDDVNEYLVHLEKELNPILLETTVSPGNQKYAANLFAQRLYHHFAMVIKDKKHDAAMKGVIRDCLWEILDLTRDQKAIGQEILDQIALNKQDLGEKIDLVEIYNDWNDSLEAKLDKQTEALKAHADQNNQTILEAIRNINSDEVSHLTKELSEKVIEVAKEKEARRRAEMTLAEREAKHAEQSRHFPTSSKNQQLSTINVETLIAQAWDKIRKFKFIDAITLAHKARRLDRRNPEANYIIGYALSEFGSSESSKDQYDAILYYEACLRIWTMEEFPQEWAKTQNAIGTAYTLSAKGENSILFSKAEKAFKASLSIRTQEKYPYEWAITLANLASLYASKQSNIQDFVLVEILKLYELASSVLTEQNYPFDWAQLRGNEGAAYAKHVSVNKKEYYDKAVHAFSDALKIITEADFPYEWTMLQNNLSVVLTEDVCTSDIDIQNIIDSLEKVLKVCEHKGFWHKWARTQDNLGGLYMLPHRDNLEGDFKKSIGSYELALTFYEKQDSRIDWAKTVNNTAVVYLREGQKGRRNSEYLFQALKSFRLSSDIFNETEFPFEYSLIQYNIGKTYLSFTPWVKNANIKHAINAFNKALSLQTKVSCPVQWACAKRDLGAAHIALVKQHTAHDKIADDLIIESLKVFNKIEHPGDWAQSISYQAILKWRGSDRNEAIKLMLEANNVYQSIGDQGNSSLAQAKILEWKGISRNK
jgi:tetratricopeptide (TPR) repeat protein